MTGREARQKTGAMETVYVLFNGDSEHYNIEPCKIFEVDVTQKGALEWKLNIKSARSETNLA